MSVKFEFLCGAGRRMSKTMKMSRKENIWNLLFCISHGLKLIWNDDLVSLVPPFRLVFLQCSLSEMNSFFQTWINLRWQFTPCHVFHLLFRFCPPQMNSSAAFSPWNSWDLTPPEPATPCYRQWTTASWESFAQVRSAPPGSPLPIAPPRPTQPAAADRRGSSRFQTSPPPLPQSRGLERGHTAAPHCELQEEEEEGLTCPALDHLSNL